MENVDDISTPSCEYKEMELHRDLPGDLLGGSMRMRTAAQKWLPMEERETPLQYSGRLMRSYLYPGFKLGTEFISAKPFVKPITIKNLDGEKLNMILTDADYSGTSLTQFAKSIFQDGVRWGIAFFLVEYPTVPMNINLAEEREMGVHPYFSRIDPRNLIKVCSALTAGGRRRIRYIRYREYVEDDVCSIVEMTAPENGQLGEVIRYEFNESKKEWVESSRKSHTFPGVPLVPFYTNRTGFMCGLPPLSDLAETNLIHWQSMSDQRNILRFARLPILFQSGVTSEDLEKPLELGPLTIVRAKNPDAKLMVVEHTGKAIEAGQKDLDSLETKMDALAMEPFVRRTQKTATGVVSDDAKSMSMVEMWVRDLEICLTTGFRYASIYAKEPLREDFGIDVYSEFSLAMRANDDIKVLQADRARGDLTHKTYLQESKRRGFLSDDVDIDQEVESSGLPTEGSGNGFD